MTDAPSSAREAAGKLRHTRGERARRSLVGLGDPGAVEAQCRDAAAAMPKTVGDSADVDIRRNQFTSAVVAELVNVHVPPEPLAHALVTVRL